MQSLWRSVQGTRSSCSQINTRETRNVKYINRNVKLVSSTEIMCIPEGWE